MDWEPDHILDPVQGPTLPLVPMGSDLPQQGQARAPVEGPITPTGFP